MQWSSLFITAYCEREGSREKEWIEEREKEIYTWDTGKRNVTTKSKLVLYLKLYILAVSDYFTL